MYKIYINETPIILLKESEITGFPPADETRIVARYTGKKKILLNYADMLEKTRRFERIIIYHDDVDRLWEDFISHYTIIEAAGGVVENNPGDVLAIFRRGFWDLPKGKIDPGESNEEAAIREVQEETGLKEVQLDRFLKETYHTYKDKKDVRILKRTFWFSMRSNEKELIPQIDEDIEIARWINVDKLLGQPEPIYRNIVDVLINWKKIKSL